MEHRELPNHWRPSLPGKRCRYVGGHVHCGRPAVVECNRGYRGKDSWWPYCEQHSYGRVLRTVTEVWYVPDD